MWLPALRFELVQPALERKTLPRPAMGTGSCKLQQAKPVLMAERVTMDPGTCLLMYSFKIVSSQVISKWKMHVRKGEGKTSHNPDFWQQLLVLPVSLLYAWTYSLSKWVCMMTSAWGVCFSSHSWDTSLYISTHFFFFLPAFCLSDFCQVL